jgi:hypothetical protein
MTVLTVIGYEVLLIPVVWAVCAGYFIWCLWRWMNRRYDGR